MEVREVPFQPLYLINMHLKCWVRERLHSRVCMHMYASVELDRACTKRHTTPNSPWRDRVRSVATGAV